MGLCVGFRLGKLRVNLVLDYLLYLTTRGHGQDVVYYAEGTRGVSNFTVKVKTWSVFSYASRVFNSVNAT